jgi:hypothetical protein
MTKRVLGTGPPGSRAPRRAGRPGAPTGHRRALSPSRRARVPRSARRRGGGSSHARPPGGSVRGGPARRRARGRSSISRIGPPPRTAPGRHAARVERRRGQVGLDDVVAFPWRQRLRAVIGLRARLEPPVVSAAVKVASRRRGRGRRPGRRGGARVASCARHLARTSPHPRSTRQPLSRLRWSAAHPRG